MSVATVNQTSYNLLLLENFGSVADVKFQYMFSINIMILILRIAVVIQFN